MPAPIGIFALPLLLLLAAGAGGGKKGDKGDPGNLPDPLDPPPPPPPPPSDDQFADLTESELTEYCCSVWSSLPEPSTVGLDELSWSVLRGLFPAFTWPPPESSSIAVHEVWHRCVGIFSAIQAGDVSCDAAIVINDGPAKAGSFYQVRKDDTPFGIINTAYPGLTASQRVKAVQLVTDHPLNAGLRVPTKLAGDKKLIGPWIFDMYPTRRELPDPFDLPTTNSQRFEPGKHLAILHLPVLV